MICTVTCFERVLHLVKPLPNEKIDTAIQIIREDSFADFLDFCADNGYFTELQSQTLYEGIVMWENFESIYFENDPDKLCMCTTRLELQRKSS